MKISPRDDTKSLASNTTTKFINIVLMDNATDTLMIADILFTFSSKLLPFQQHYLWEEAPVGTGHKVGDKLGVIFE